MCAVLISSLMLAFVLIGGNKRCGDLYFLIGMEKEADLFFQLFAYFLIALLCG